MTVSKSNEYSISQNLHILGNLVDMRLRSNDQDLLNQMKLIEPISYQYYFGADKIGTDYSASYVLDGHLFGIARGTVDEYEFKPRTDELDEVSLVETSVDKKSTLLKRKPLQYAGFDESGESVSNFNWKRMDFGDFNDYPLDPLFIKVF
jgi:hypothetical protein